MKNFWNSCIKKKLVAQGQDPKTHNLLPSNEDERMQQSNGTFTINSSEKMSEAKVLTDHHHHHQLPVQSTPHVLTLPAAPQTACNPSQASIVTQEAMPTMSTSFPYGNGTRKDDQGLHVNSVNYFLAANVSNANAFFCNRVSSAFNSSMGCGFTEENYPWDGNHNEAAAPRNEVLITTHDHDKEDNIMNRRLTSEEATTKGQEILGTHSNFDLGFIESTLVPAGDMYCNAISMDQLAWDY